MEWKRTSAARRLFLFFISMKHYRSIMAIALILSGVTSTVHAQTLLDTSAAVSVGADLDSSAGASANTMMNLGTDPSEQAYARGLAASDTNIHSVSMNQQKVSVSYTTDVKLLGFIPVRMPVTASAYATGEATVNYPWYKFLSTTKIDANLESDVRMAASDGSLMLSAPEREVLAERLYNALKANLSVQANGSTNY
jgi:hypothetical protein